MNGANATVGETEAKKRGLWGRGCGADPLRGEGFEGPLHVKAHRLVHRVRVRVLRASSRFRCLAGP